jgi:hypothetical protein
MLEDTKVHILNSTEMIDMPHFKLARTPNKVADYRLNVFDEDHPAEHPLQCEEFKFELTFVGHAEMEPEFSQDVRDEYQYRYNKGQFNEPEMELIKNVMKRPEVEWAVDNSFDGIYIHKYNDAASFKTVFKFAVYMEANQATFWRLKYG